MVQEAEFSSIAGLELGHRRINELLFEGRALLRTAFAGADPDAEAEARSTLRQLFIELREELLAHFAREEEGLFPFLREHLPALGDAVDRLALAHDDICAAVVGLARLGEAPDRSSSAVRAALEAFERAYAVHEREERDVLRALSERLERRQRVELNALLRSL